jgi:hypothetical protein
MTSKIRRIANYSESPLEGTANTYEVGQETANIRPKTKWENLPR